MKTSKKGISLIVLVITIIVMTIIVLLFVSGVKMNFFIKIGVWYI